MGTLLAFPVLLLTLLSLPVTLSFFLEWGPDLEGPWCATRPVGQDCCSGRDDYCGVPILGTECYCDIFCNDTAYDCCPDYWAHCHGQRRPATTPLPTTTRRPVRNTCELNGIFYQPGQKVKNNCVECTCDLFVTSAGLSREYRMQCTDDVCLIRPELMDMVNTGPYTWQASNYSFLWGLTLDEGVRYRLGTYPLGTEVVQMTPIKVSQDEALPEAFDARQKWPGKLHPIRDQGNCASSWAFSTTAVASDRLSIESDGSIIEELSAQHMLSCDTDGQDGCTGGKVDRAWFFLRRHGVVTEACYPYDSGLTSVGGACLLPLGQSFGDCPSGIEYKLEKRYKASPPYRIRPLEREIMKEIMDNGPVQAILEVKEDFYMYKSGVYQYASLTRNDPPSARKSDYHSVRLIGWGVELTSFGTRVPYWIAANSWGPAWGENGYFRILRGANESQIENSIIGAWGKVTGDVSLHRLLVESRRRRLQARGQAGRSGRRLRKLNRRRRRRRHHEERHAKGPESTRRRNRRGKKGKRQREERRRNKVAGRRKNKDWKKKQSRKRGRQQVIEDTL